MAKSTYKDAGVDLDLYRKSMAKLPHHLHRTFTPRVIGMDGGFAGLFQLDFANQLFANIRIPFSSHVRTGLEPNSKWPNKPIVTIRSVSIWSQ